MINKIILILISAFIFSSSVYADTFDWKRSDHQTHVFASYGLALTSTMIFEKHKFTKWESIFWGSIITLGVGIAKEYALDSTASDGDLVADTIGTVLSAGVVLTFDL